MVDRSKSSFIPGWLKGTGGGSLTTHCLQDDGGFRGAKATHQFLTDGQISPSFRRNPLARTVSDKDHLGRSNFNLHRSSSARNNDWGKDSSAVRSDQEYVHDGDGRKEAPINERNKDRDYVDHRPPSTGSSPLIDSEVLKRSQSHSFMIPERSLRKGYELASNVQNVGGNLMKSVNKAVFDRNFPSLGSDEKQSNIPLSLVNGNSSLTSSQALVGSPRPFWQGSNRLESNWPSPPGLTGGFPNSILSPSITGAAVDAWSSVLVESPSSNGSLQVSSSAAALSNTNGPSPGTTMTPMNMAEALTQNPPRVRTPNQALVESQRLEELALKQSRQLIPVIPSLPKTMVLADKSKSKVSRAGDATIIASKGNQQQGSAQTNLSHKSVTTVKLDTSKYPQGKLLVLKSGKDGVTVSSTTKTETNGNPPLAPHGVPGLTVSASSVAMGTSLNSGTAGQRKQERRGVTYTDELRQKVSAAGLEDRRPSLQAQNRSDFFNSIRKKSGTSGHNSHTSNPLNQTKNDGSNSVDTTNKNENFMDDGTRSMMHTSETKSSSSALEICGNGSEHKENGISSMDNSLEGALLKENCKEETHHAFLPGASEEEEAAFMRSLGWEENAEGGELTEEEINAFYNELQEKKNFLDGRCNQKLRTLSVSKFVGSVDRTTSGLSS